MLKINKKAVITSILLSLSSVNILNATDIDNIIVEAKKEVTAINTKQLTELLKEDPNMQVIDVRNRAEITKDGGYPKVNNYTNISRDKIEFLISQNANKNDKFVVHCLDGNRSLLVAKTLKNMGYKNVLWYQESFNGWRNAGLKSSSLDKYPGSMLYNKIAKIDDGVYTSIGITAPYWYESSAHNNNLGFIIGDDSVLVWNAGSSYLLAQSLHKEIKKITDKPVKYVVLENSQGHAILGSNYWKEQGAQIIAQEIAKGEIERKGKNTFNRLKKVLGDRFDGTELVMPDTFFKDEMKFDLGGKIVEAKYFGYAHEHSDIMIWLPKERIAFAGDLAFNNRLLPIFEITETQKWLEAWDKFAALEPEVVVPGHGDVTDLETVTKYTKDYLVYLREKIEEILDEDGGLEDAYEINMDAYKHLDTYKELGRQNIARVFKQMEFE